MIINYYDRLRVLYKALNALKEYDNSKIKPYLVFNIIIEIKKSIRKIRDNFLENEDTPRIKRIRQLKLKNSIIQYKRSGNKEIAKIYQEIYTLLYAA